MPKTRRPLAVVVSDLGAGAGEYLQTDAAAVQLVNRRHQMLQIAAQAVKLPDDESVARMQCLQSRLQAWAVIMTSGGTVLVDALLGHAGADQSVALQIES